MPLPEADRKWGKNFRASKRRQDLKIRAIALLGGHCILCGYDGCPSAMDFHHPDAREKDFTISSGSSWEKIQQELKNTVLLCCRCHREVHAGWHPQLLVLEDDGREGGEDF